METDNALYFANILEWRQWLEQNHDKQKGVWLIHFKKNSGQHSINYPEALEEALCFGWIDGKMKGIDEERFALRYSPRKPRSIWSQKNREKAESLIKQGRMTPAGLKKIDEAQANGLWDNAYTGKKAEEIPADLKEALEKNKDAGKNFHRFANSYRNMYIAWVNNARTAVTRQKRITEVVKRSSLNMKPGI
jgi:uncharacterized protein YdeI (YjbR/CyaY-like superfamily)